MMMLPFPHPGGWLPMLPFVGAAPARGWVPLPLPRGAAAAPVPAGWMAIHAPRAPATGWLPLPLPALLPRGVRPPQLTTHAAAVVTLTGTPPRARRRHAISFVVQLKKMLEAEDAIRWRDGAIVIPDPAALERRLSTYYKHSKYASFQRQLNNFGYRRKYAPDAGEALETVYERAGATAELEDLLVLRPVLPRPADRKRPRAGGKPAASARRVRAAGAAPAAVDAAASLLALGGSSA